VARRVAIAALFITGIVNALHYAYKIALGFPLQPEQPEALRDLSRAAAWADGWMGLMAILGGVGLLRGRPWGWLCGIVGAAALVHMGFLDVAFFAQHGMYGNIDLSMAEMIVVDTWALCMGSFLIGFLWADSRQPPKLSSDGRLFPQRAKAPGRC
jgi:hypothetical protein